MMNYDILNKFSENFVQNWQSIVKSALHICVAFLFWTMITVAYDWTFLGVRPLRVDQMIFLISAISTTIILTWEHTTFGSRFMRASTEIVIFIYIEVAVLTTITLNVAWLCKYYVLSKNLIQNPAIQTEDNTFVYIGILAALGYIIILFSVMNTVIHSMLIYHLIRGTEKKVAKYSTLVRVVYCLLGIVLIMGLGLLIFKQPIFVEYDRYQKHSHELCLILLLSEASVFFVVTIIGTELSHDDEARSMEKVFSAPFRRLWHAVALGLLIVSIVAIVVEHKQTSTMSSVNHLDENLKQNVLPRIWSLTVCCSVAVLRHFYLMRKIAGPNTYEIRSSASP